MKKFTYKEFMNGEFSILVNRKTIKNTLEQLSKTGLKWHSGESSHEFVPKQSLLDGYMCLTVENGSLGWTSVLLGCAPLITINQLTIESDDIKSNDFIGLCVKSKFEKIYSVGELYYFKNGVATWNNGGNSGKYSSIEDFNDKNISFQMIEIKEVKRKAKPGEYVKIVDPQEIPKTNGVLDYDKGSILKIIKIDEGDCHYSDKCCGYLHDDEYVVLEGYKELEIKVGDMVEVVENGESFSSYDEWFEETDNLEYKSHYVEFKCPSKNKRYKVVCKGSHNNPDSYPDGVYCIQDLDTTQVFLMCKDGIKK